MKTLIMGALLISSSAFASAESFTYDCGEVRTTAQEETATTMPKTLQLKTDRSKFVLSASDVMILSIDERLLTGGAPLRHDTYGGYFTSTDNEIFVCQRPM